MIPYRSVHFVGVLTCEMASLAVFTVLSGCKVTGSDDHIDPVLSPPLRKSNVTLFDMFAQVNISKTTELVVVSPYYDIRHIEVTTAQNLKIPVMTATEYAKLLSQSMRRLVVLDDYEGPLVATWLAHTLLGSHVPVNALTKTVTQDNQGLAVFNPEASWFIMPVSGFKRDSHTYEASFLSYDAELVIIPTIRYDYPELNMTLDDVYQSYYRFVKNIPRKGLIIGNGDYSRMKRLRSHLADRHIETYGFDPDVSWRIKDVTTTDMNTTFSLTHSTEIYGPFTIPHVGTTMVYDAVAMIVASLLLDVKSETIERTIATLPRLRRYYEVHHGKRLVIFDQADHPDSIATRLETIRSSYPDKKIWCLYQPGSYLRTKNLSEELKQSLAGADVVYLADIKGYPKEKSEGLHIRHFISEMRQSHPQTHYLDQGANISQMLEDRVGLNDCIVVFGHEGFCQTLVHSMITDNHD